MARNNANIKVGEDAWIELTNADTTSITFQNKGPGVVEVKAVVGAVAPTDFDGALRYGSGAGEIGVDVAALNKGAAVNRVYARCIEGGFSNVSVSHA